MGLPRPGLATRRRLQESGASRAPFSPRPAVGLASSRTSLSPKETGRPGEAVAEAVDAASGGVLHVWVRLPGLPTEGVGAPSRGGEGVGAPSRGGGGGQAPSATGVQSPALRLWLSATKTRARRAVRPPPPAGGQVPSTSVRLMSLENYTMGLVLDATHVPSGCSLWPVRAHEGSGRARRRHAGRARLSLPLRLPSACPRPCLFSRPRSPLVAPPSPRPPAHPRDLPPHPATSRARIRVCRLRARH